MSLPAIVVTTPRPLHHSRGHDHRTTITGNTPLNATVFRFVQNEANRTDVIAMLFVLIVGRPRRLRSASKAKKFGKPTTGQNRARYAANTSERLELST